MVRKALILIISVFILDACSTVPRIEKQGIIAYGFKDDMQKYDSISINLDKVPSRLVPQFCLVLGPNAKPLRSDRLTEDSVSEYLPKFKIPKYWPETWKKQASEINAFEGHGFYIAFENGILKTIGMGTRQSNPNEPITNPVSPAIIGPIDCQNFYQLPITRHQFVEIFGEPEKENMVREVYY